MRCQLARIIEPKDAIFFVNPQFVGWYVWVAVGPPTVRVAQMYHVETKEVVDILRPVYMALLNDHGRPLGVSLECLELLPYFDDVVPIHYKDWIARGGDALPLDKTGN